MSANAYRLLGYVVWKVSKSCLRRRLPPPRSLALAGLAAGGAVTAAVLIARRASG